MTFYNVFLSLIGIAISWIIFYRVVKAAVRNGIREAKFNQQHSLQNPSKVDSPANAEQAALNMRYEKGEISFAEFQSEWNRLI